MTTDAKIEAISHGYRVLDVHDLHVWTIGSGETSLSCHAVSGIGVDTSSLLASFNQLLESDFAIHHATIQVEPARGPETLDTEVGCTTSCEPEPARTGTEDGFE